MPIRLLIVEDSDDDALLILRQFRRAGVEIVSRRADTAGGLSAALAEEPPDVVICDYNMPGFSAHEALDLLRADPAMDVPFILVSGEVGEETAAALMRAGADDFVLKDRLTRLVPAVERELREAAGRRQRRAAQAALHDSEERLRLLADHAQDIIFRYRWDPPAVEYVSPAVTAILGHTPDELYADPALLLSLVDPEDLPALEASWRSPAPESMTVRWRRRDGEAVYMEQRAAGVADPAGRIVAVEGILRDATERVLAEEQRRGLEHQLRQNERLDSLGHLAGGVAHDFNNLLAVITGYCGMLAESLPPDDPAVGDVEGIRRAAERGASLTRQLLIFSRLEPSRLETFDLNAVVSETRELLSRTLGEDIEFICELAPDLRPVTVDRSKMEQVLLNLIMNARAAMPSGGPLTIRTDNRPDGQTEPPGLCSPPPHPGSGCAQTVMLTVTDVGHGMDPEVARRAFEPFFTTRPKGQGTGLGLATAYGAVTDAGGTIELDSAPGRGTTVRVCLPASTPPPEEPAPTQAGPPAGQGESVLLVEDEDGVREVVRRILTRSGYRVREVGSPVEALHIFAGARDEFDVLLTDVVMPGMSGTQLAAQLREQRQDLPVLFMSGYTMGPAPGGHELPSDGSLLHKPFDRPTLLAALHRALHAR